ncbi:MAG: 23S rRNA (guanosine(2251)-2'-O)-methyltransferase RlmB [Saprospiraceae bacterium]|nr:23S rRNA (guanosine(2251)-2'-O)-methyltransferase RlmB [Saprospiraceae bacterium]
MSEGQVIYGKHPVLEALNEELPIEKILVLQGTHGELEKTLRETCKDRSIPMQQVPKEVLYKLCKGNNHQGVAAIISPVEYQDLKGLLPFILAQDHHPLFLVLDRITDVRNLGAIARSAELLGVDALIVSSKHRARIDEEAIKTSAGALLKLSVCRENSLVTTIDVLKSAGIRIVAADAKAAAPIRAIDFSQPIALILGSEDEGVHPSLLDKCDDRFQIPQSGTIDSFNVSVAAGIILYEIYNQRHPL